MSENVEVKIGVDIDDQKAKAKFNDTMQALQAIANSKALNLKIDVNENALKNLSKIESTIKEINKLSRESQKALFGGNSGTNGESALSRRIKEDNKIMLAGMKEEQKIRKQQEKERQQAVEAQRKRMEQQRKEQQQFNQQLEQARNKELQAMNRYYQEEERLSRQRETSRGKDSGKLYDRHDNDFLSSYLKQLDQKNRALRESAQKESQILRQQEREYSNYARNLSSSMSKAQSELTKLNKSGFSDSASVHKLQADLDRVISSVNWDRVDRLTFNRSIAEVRKLEQEIKQATNVAENNKRAGEIKLFSEKTFAQLEKFKREFKEIGSLGSEFNRIENAVRGLDAVAPDKLPHAMKSIRQEVSHLNNDLKHLNTNMSHGGFKNFFGDLYDSMRTFTLGNMLGDAIQNSVYKIKDMVIGLDSSLTNMMKVAPANFRGTAQELKNVAREANEVGKSVGRSTQDVIEGTAKALQTGAKTMKDAMEIAKASSMFANVGDLKQEQADTYIASIMSAYGGMDKALQPVQKRVQGMGKDYNNLTKFMDLANYAGNNFAISTGDVGEALQRSGAVLSQYGVSMEDSVAMIVGANESIQDSAKVGTSLKSMAINMAGVKASAKDGTLELNKTAKALKEIGGIDIYSDKKTGQVKDMMTILTELQAKYKDLSQDEQLALGEAIAGKHHANTFQAMMGNWGKVIEMQKAYKEGMTIGSAEKENERYLNSVEGKINVLKQNIQQLVSNVISSGFAKSVLDIAISVTDGLVKISNGIDDLGLSIPTAIGLFTSLFQVIRSLGAGEAGRIGSIFGAIKKGIKTLNGTAPAMDTTRRAIRNTTQSLADQAVVMNTNDRVIKNYTSGNKKLRASKESLNATLGRSSMKYKEVARSSKASYIGMTSTGKAFKVNASNATALSTNLGRLKDSNVKLTTVVGSTEKVVSRTGSGFKNLAGSVMKTTAGQMALNVGTSLLNGALVSLVGVAIAGAIQAFHKMATAQSRAREEAQNNINAINEDIASNKNKISVLDDVGRKYEELAKKTNRTAEETKQMNEHANELAKILPELKIGEDEDGNAIISMSGDVDYLISKLEQANKVKRDLLKAEVSEKAEASMKLLSKGEMFDSSALEKRNDVQARYDRQMIQLENQRQGILSRMRNAEGKDIKKYNDQLKALEAEKSKITTQFTGEYIKAQQKVQEYANDIRQDSLNIARDSAEFARLTEEGQQKVTDFIGLMDFSEVNADNIDQVNGSIEKMISACADGKLDLGEYKDKIAEIEKEFAKTGNIEEYNSQMEKLAREISNVSGADYSVVLNMLKKMDDAYLKTGNGINDFLKSYDKSIKDVMNGNKFAEALKQQYDALQSTYDQIIEGMSGDAVIDKKIALNFITDENLPEELRNFIDTAINKQGKDPTKVLKVLQKIIPELQKGGDMDIAKVQKIIDDELGKNTFEVTPKMKMSGKAQVAQMDEFIDKVKEKYDEIPKDIETTIRANTTTSMSDVDTMMNMYRDFPEDVQTMIKTLGKEEAYEKMMSMQSVYNSIPKELMTYLKANGVNSVSEATRVADIFNQLPENVQTYLLANNSDALVNAQSVDDVYKNLPQSVKTEVEMDVTKVTEKKSLIDIIMDRLGKTKTTAKADMDKSGFDSKAQALDQQIRGTNQKKATVKINGNNSDATKKAREAEQKINNVKQRKPVPIKGNDSDAKQKAKSADREINKVKQKKPAEVKAKDSTGSGVESAKRSIGSVKDKTVTITSIFHSIFKTTGKPAGGGSAGRLTARAPMPRSNNAPKRAMTLGASSGGEGAQPLGGDSGLGAPASNAPSTMGALGVSRRTQSTPIDTSKFGVLDAVKFSIELLKELQNRISMVSNEIGILDEKMTNAVGNEKIAYLNRQNELFREQLDLQKELQQKLQDQKVWLKNELQWNGFNFNGDENLVNYEEKLLALEREAERLSKIADDSSKKVSDYKGEDEKHKNNLQSQYEADKKRADQAKDSLSEVKKMLTQYLQITMTDIPNAQKEWEKLNNQILANEKAIKKEADALEEANRRQRTYLFNNKLKELEHHYKALSIQLDLISSKMENAYGKDKIALIEQQIALLEEQKKKQHEIYMQNNHSMWEYKQDMYKYGFQFDNKHNVTNLDEVLNKYEGSEDLEKINKLLEEYLKLHEGMYNAKESWEKLDAEIKKAYKEQLSITKEIEHKITEVYKKQIEERKKLIQDELDAKLKALDKEKKAYNEARKEADYNKEVTDQQKVISDLEKQIDILSRDTSLSGQKKLKELMEKLAQEQEKLSNTVQQKIDEQVNNMFDKESERLEEEANKAKEDLDEKYSDEKLQQIVKDTLASGVFVGLNGEIQDLQKVLIDFEDKFGDGMSAMGDVIKNQLVANLNVAKDTIKDMSKIMGELGLEKYSSMAFNSGVISSRGVASNMARSNATPVVHFNSPLVNIEGNVDKGVLPDLEKVLDKVKDEIVEEIAKSIK